MRKPNHNEMNPEKVVPGSGPRHEGQPVDTPDRARDLGPFEPDHIYQGDALDLLSRIPQGSIDLIVTDPPFAIDFQAQRLNYNRTGGHVMEGYREIPPEEYEAFTREWVGQAYRALAPTGSIYLFSGWNRLRDVLAALDDAGFVTLNHLIWKYQFGVFTRKKFVTSHYHILYAVKNPKEYTFHKIDHYPEDVWVINREYWKGRKKTPTKLPSALVRKIMEYSSNPGDLVLDPFLGSGTVAAVAHDMGRHFLGFEIVEEYFNFARERIDQAHAERPNINREPGRDQNAEGET